MDFDDVRTFLQRLEEEYPDVLHPDRLQDLLDFSDEKFETIRSYLQEREHISYEESDNKDSKGWKVTAEGRDFLKDLEKQDTENKRRRMTLVATIIIAMFTLVTGAMTWYGTTPHIYYTTGSLECPSELDEFNTSYSPDFSNDGDSPGYLSWNIKGENVTITSEDYSLSDGFNLGSGETTYLSFKISANPEKYNRGHFTFSYESSGLIPSLSNSKIICEYEKQEDRWGYHFQLVDERRTP